MPLGHTGTIFSSFWTSYNFKTNVINVISVKYSSDSWYECFQPLAGIDFLSCSMAFNVVECRWLSLNSDIMFDTMEYPIELTESKWRPWRPWRLWRLCSMFVPRSLLVLSWSDLAVAHLPDLCLADPTRMTSCGESQKVSFEFRQSWVNLTNSICFSNFAMFPLSHQNEDPQPATDTCSSAAWAFSSRIPEIWEENSMFYSMF